MEIQIKTLLDLPLYAFLASYEQFVILNQYSSVRYQQIELYLIVSAVVPFSHLWQETL